MPLERITPQRSASACSTEKPGVGQGLPRRRHGELGEAAHALGFLTAQQGLRVEALDLCRQLYLLGGGIVMGDGADAAHAVFHGLPAFSRRQADGGHSPQTGDNNSASFHSQRSSLHTHAAVNGQNLPGDVAGVLAG